ncbi:MAG: hypothetical protein UHD09_08395 [Bifidobacterium sp.]|nr:hypothetical protein [Bifidobacterium sp.]
MPWRFVYDFIEGWSPTGSNGHDAEESELDLEDFGAGAHERDLDTDDPAEDHRHSNPYAD